MATRTKKAPTPRPEPVPVAATSASAATPQPTTTFEPVSSQTPTRSSSPTRPVSPARLSRMQERTQLQSLNDRLANYIDRVRSLETENYELRSLVSKQQTNREITQIKNAFNKELHDTRSSLDNLARTKAELELKLSREQENNKDLADRIKKLNSELNGLNKKVMHLESTSEDLKTKLQHALADRKKADADLKDAADENRDLKTRLESARAQLEEETLLRVDLENRNQTLNEDLEFNRNLWSKQLEEIREEKTETKEMILKNVRDQYEEKMADELRALRDENNERLRVGRENLEACYEEKLDTLREEVAKKAAALAALEKTNKVLKSSQALHTREISDLRYQVAHLSGRAEDLEKLLDLERNENREVLRARDREVDEFREQLEQLTDEFNDLNDEKMKIDAELAVYRKLLESEESRLQITPRSPEAGGGMSSSSSPLGSFTPRFLQRGNKRKRIHVEEEENLVDVAVVSNAKTELEISDQDLEGKSVQLLNKGDKDISLAGFTLLRDAGAAHPQTRYKFTRNIIIKPGAKVNIWSADADEATHQPPSDIVMKGQTWFSNESVTTFLYSPNGEEIASRKSEKRISSSSNRLLTRLDESERNGNENCSIM